MIPIALTEHRKTTKWLQFKGKRIKLNSVIVIHEENDPEFYIVECIFYKNEEDFEVITKCIENCFYDDYYQAFKIFDDERFCWKL